MARLSVFIGANDAELQAAIKRAKKGLQDFGREMREGINVAAKWTAAMAASGAAISAYMVRQTMEAIDAQAKLAQRMNTTVASVAALEHAGGLAGVSAEQLETAARSLTSRLGEAAMGTGDAAKALERLGLNANELAAMPLDQRIALINERIRENIPLAQQAAIAADLFGERAAQAILLLDADQIREAAENTRIFGTALSDIDAAKVEQANDAISRISLITDGFWKQLTVKVAPVLEAIANKLFEAAKEAGGLGNVAAEAFNKIVTAAGFALDAADGVRRAFVIAADLIIIAMSKTAAVVADIWAGVLRMLDKIPGVDFSETIASVESFARESHSVVDQAVANIEETLMKPLPSEGLKRFVAEAEQAANQVARAGVAARQAVLEAAPAGEGEDENEREAFEKRLEALRNRFLTEEELKRQHQQVLIDLDRAFQEGRFETEQEYFAIIEEAQRQHMERLKAIRERGLTELEKFTATSFKNQAKTIAGELADITAGVAQHSRSMFELNKAAGISMAIINAYEGISKTLAAYPYPISIAMAAAQGAAAFAQVQAIRSQQFGGGGGAAPSLAGGTPATPVTPVGGGTPQAAAPQQLVTVNLQGEFFNRQTVIGLIEQINEAVADGARIRVA